MCAQPRSVSGDRRIAIAVIVLPGTRFKKET